MRNGKSGELKEDSKEGEENILDDDSAINLIKSFVFNNSALTDGERKQLETIERMFQDKVNALLKLS